ncbi:MAG: SMI1/KNR4 family protein [Oscillospiraceae bacterium]|nr:SMI1/KNR4 family protein [Oscillospiraceae bacterium]
MNIIKLIKENNGENCRLRSPLTKEQFEKARKQLPGELLEILKVSNGINEVIKHPVTGKTEVIGSLVYPLSEILSQTEYYESETGGGGYVFADNGAGDHYILKPDGSIALYEYMDMSETPHIADSLYDFFS